MIDLIDLISSSDDEEDHQEPLGQDEPLIGGASAGRDGSLNAPHQPNEEDAQPSKVP